MIVVLSTCVCHPCFPVLLLASFAGPFHSVSFWCTAFRFFPFVCVFRYTSSLCHVPSPPSAPFPFRSDLLSLGLVGFSLLSHKSSVLCFAFTFVSCNSVRVPVDGPIIILSLSPSTARRFCRRPHDRFPHPPRPLRKNHCYFDFVPQEKRKGKLAAANTVLHRDLNDYRSDTITHWSCATREILFRVANGLDLEQIEEAIPADGRATGG